MFLDFHWHFGEIKKFTSACSEGGGEDLWSPKFLYLNAKYDIHNKIDDNNIEFLHFLYVLKFNLDIEHKICKMNNTSQTFNKFVFLYDQMWYQHILFMK